MEYVDGGTVRSLLQDGRLPIARAVDIAKQAAEGVANAHEAGLIHRDLKPENLMITSDGVVKILDFGLPRSILRRIGRRGARNRGSSDAVRRDHQVLGLQVPVNEPRLVGVGDALGRLLRDVHRPRDRQSAVLKERTDRAAVHVLHHDVGTRGLSPTSWTARMFG